MKKTNYFLLTILLILALILPISASTFESGIFSSYSVLQENKSAIAGGTVGSFIPNAVYFKDIGSIGTIQTILYTGTDSTATTFFTRDAGEYYSGQAPFTSGLGSGLIGYNEVYDANGNFLFKFFYITYDTFNSAGLTGNRWDNLTYNHTLVHNLTFSLLRDVSSLNTGDYGAWIGISSSGYIRVAYPAGQPYSVYVYNNIEYSFENDWFATDNIGYISGIINKTMSGSAYSSRGFVYDENNNILMSEDYPPNSLEWNITVFHHPIRIGVIDVHNISYTSNLIFPSSGGATPTPTPAGGITPTPTITPAPTDTWTMEIYPTAINLGESAQLYISCTNSSRLADAGTVLYYENNNLGAYSHYNLVGVYHWNISTSNWDFRVNNTAPYDYTAHDPALLMVTPTTNGLYTYQSAVFGKNSIAFGTTTEDLLIGAQGGQSSSLTMLLWASDILTLDHLSNYQLQVTDYTGFTRFYDVEYDLELSLQRGGVYTLAAVKEGYENRAITFTVPVNQDIQSGDFGAMQSVKLYPIGQLPSAGNCTVTVHVDDKETYYPLANVQVSMSGFTAPKFTGLQGEGVFFIIPQNTAFTVRASKEGYCAVSDTKNTSTETNMYIPLFMKFGTCAGAAPIHTPIPNATPVIPIPTMIGGYGQLNGTAAVCNHLPINASVVDYIRNSVACFGITDLLSQNLALSIFIILFIASIAAMKAKAIGFAIGAIVGAVIAMAAGLLPFWIIVILIILAIAVLSIKIFFSGGN